MSYRPRLPAGANRGKGNDIFRPHRANWVEWLLTFFIPFPNSHYIEMYWSEEEQPTGLSKWNGKFWSDRKNLSKWTTFTILFPNIPVGPNQKGPFNLTSDWNFRNCRYPKYPPVVYITTSLTFTWLCKLSILSILLQDRNCSSTSTMMALPLE